MQLKAVLPSGISQAIRSTSKTKAQEQRLLRLAGYVFRKHLYDGIPFDEPIEISREHFRNQMGTHYLRDLDALRNARIIITDHRYTLPLTDPRTGERLALGQCKRHGFAPDLIFSDPDLIRYTETARGYITGDWVTRETGKLLSKIRLTLDERNLAPYVADQVTPEFIRARAKIGEEIPPGYYHVTGFRYPLERDRLIEIAARSGLDLILYRNKCHIAQAERFLNERRIETQNRYLAALIALKQARKRPAIYCSRNETNRRLDTNLTALKSDLLGLVRLDGEPLVSIDLKNSQFRLLAHLIEITERGVDLSEHFKTFFMCCRTGFLGDLSQEENKRNRGEVINRLMKEICIINVTHFREKNGEKSGLTYSRSGDLERFKKLTKVGEFYEDLAREMTKAEGRPISRSDAKQAMFLAAFSSHRYQPPAKKLLARISPDLVQWVDGFKRSAIGLHLDQGKPKDQARDLGDAALAVALQNIESLIFVDVILADLLARGFRVFSKHDSILCKPSDLDQVSAIIRDHLDAILGAGGYQLETTFDNL